MPDASPGPATRAERAEQRARIHELVEKLPEEERAVVDLLYYLHLSHAEAAEQLSVSTKWIQRKWRSARLLLGDWLLGTL